MTSRNAIAILGSRDIDRATARTLFEHHLSPFVSSGRTWILGGSPGLEQWAMEWLIEQSETCWIVIAYTRSKQPGWLQPWLEEVDRVVELGLPKRKNASAIRNRHMVELSGILFGFWSGQGGLIVRAMKHAIRMRKEVHAIPVFK